MLLFELKFESLDMSPFVYRVNLLDVTFDRNLAINPSPLSKLSLITLIIN